MIPRIFCLIALLAVFGCKQDTTPGTPPEEGKTGKVSDEGNIVDIKGYGRLKLVGPFNHKNLSVYVLQRTESATDEDFITLEEGLNQKLVTVSEHRDGEQVEKLQIENKSDKPLFIQAGDLVKGGKQDRTIQASLVIPPKSGLLDIPAFCVEQSRWSGAKQFDAAGGSGGVMAYSKGSKLAVREDKEQSKVWEEVEKSKGALAQTADAPSETSSLNEELEKPKVKESIEKYKDPIMKSIEGVENSIGLVYAINGEINSVEVYLSHKLFKKLTPKLVSAAATEALTKLKDAKGEAPVKESDIISFCVSISKQDFKKDREDYIENESLISSTEKAAYFQQKYKGKECHLEFMTR